MVSHRKSGERGDKLVKLPRGQQISEDAAASMLLVFAALAALIFANSPLAWAYRDLLSLPVEARVGELQVAKPLVLWINDGLMAIFFFVVGLEIKSELMEGSLSSRDRAALPAVAALGGMAAPAAIYAAIAWNDPAALPGWAIPAATDIAFAIGVLGLLGNRIPAALRVFLLALAVLDDLGAIIIIALFYTDNLSAQSLMLAALFIAALAAMNRFGVRRDAAYVFVGIALWLAVLKSGVHATLAGVITALFVPLRDGKGGSPLHGMAADLKLPVNFGIVPLFAFANAGVPLLGLGFTDLTTTVTKGVALGLVVGKPLGILAAVALLIWSGAGRLPAKLRWGHIAGAGALGGIGFTMSLFIGTLAFDASSVMNEVRLGVLFGSAISTMVGVAILLRVTNGTKKKRAI